VVRRPIRCGHWIPSTRCAGRPVSDTPQQPPPISQGRGGHGGKRSPAGVPGNGPAMISFVMNNSPLRSGMEGYSDYYPDVSPAACRTGARSSLISSTARPRRGAGQPESAVLATHRAWSCSAPTTSGSRWPRSTPRVSRCRRSAARVHRGRAEGSETPHHGQALAADCAPAAGRNRAGCCLNTPLLDSDHRGRRRDRVVVPGE